MRSAVGYWSASLDGSPNITSDFQRAWIGLTMSELVRIAGDVDLDQIDGVEDALQPIIDPYIAGATVDLSELETICPAGLALLIAALRTRVISRGGGVDPYVPPRASALQCWLSEETIGKLVTPHTGRLRATDASAVGFDGCEPFSDGEGITRAAYALCASLRRRVPLGDSMLGSIGALLSELSENVLQHGTVRGGVAAAGVVNEGRELELAVADRGRGVKRSLARNPRYQYLADDSAAIEKALRAGVSGDSLPSGGIGLFMAGEVIARNGGRLIIRSGRGLAGRPAGVATATPTRRLEGTLVVARVRVDRPLDYQAVDDQAASPRGLMAQFG